MVCPHPSVPPLELDEHEEPDDPPDGSQMVSE